MTRIEYRVVPADRALRSIDVRAAADACNLELMNSGETWSRRAAEEQIESCAECLRDDLEVVVHEPDLIEIMLSGTATESEIWATVDRAAIILGRGSANLNWSAFGRDRPPSDAERVAMAKELLDAALEARRQHNESPAG